MMTPIFARKMPYCFAVLYIASIFSGFKSAAQQRADIILRDERLLITPKEFYIANVVDERDDRTAIAWLLPENTENSMPKTYPVDLQDGAVMSVRQFIDHNLPRNTALRPVIIRLKKFMVTENSLAGGRAEGHVSLIVSFDLKGDDDDSPTE